MPTYSYNAVFDCQTASAQYGKIRIATTETGAGLNPTYFGFEITSPSGVIIKAMPNVSTTPDVIGSSLTALYDIPLDSTGGFLCGTYSIKVNTVETPFWIGVGVPPAAIETTQTATYLFCAVEKSEYKANLKVGTSYVTGKITLDDLSVIAGLTSLVRALSITPPTIPSVVLAPVTTTARQLIYSFTYTGVTYIARLLVNAELITIATLTNWTFNHRLTQSSLVNININAAVMATLRTQANAVLIAIEEELCKTLKCDCATTIRYMKIMRLLHNIQISYLENNAANLDADLQELYRLMKVTQPTNTIAPFTPPS
jgi:hypothetical protein